MIFWLALGFVALERVGEMAWARRNAKRLLAQGARFVREDGMGLIVATHVLFFVLAILEWCVAPWAGFGWWTALGAVLFVAGDGLRFWAIGSLGERWNTRVYVLDAPLVASGPYRRVRHPNYVGVGLVVAGFPLAFGLFATAGIITLLNLAAVSRRIRLEEEALGI